MKNIAILLCFVSLAMTGCKPQTDVLPQGIWSEGCAQLSPDTAGYRLSGMCCTYVLFPNKLISANGALTVKGSTHSFTGAGFSNDPIDITIQKTVDGALVLSYPLPSVAAPTVFQLTPGPAIVACDCFCY